MEGLRITHEFDERGRRSITNRHTRRPVDALEVSTRRMHTYDAEGNEVERVFPQLREGVWVDGRKATSAVRPQP